jgi:carboxypeptidase Taq
MTLLEKLNEKISEYAHLGSTLALLSWDQEVMMPEGGANFRAQTISYMAGLQHQIFVEDVDAALKAIEDGGLDQYDAFHQRNFKRIRRDLDKYTKLPKAHVVEMGRITSEGVGAWVNARKQSDFSLFAPHLSEIVRLKRIEAEYFGYEENPYDALIDAYEPDMTAKKISAIFEPFKAELGDLLRQIAAQPQIDDDFMRQPIATDIQLAFSKMVLEKTGYDFKHGRQDISAHPFSININPEDVRITTMVQSDDIREMLYSSIHEGGHALYEQGLPSTHFGWPASTACSLGIHESQSRLWENVVARCPEFWDYFFPQLAAIFPDQLKGRSAEDVFRSVNKVNPGFIRISSDELTYHFHVILRFEIENALINREFEVKDLPAVWNEKVRKYLGLEVTNDAQGVLQDIHWSHGSIGYFPTYSLGSFYSVQFMDAAAKAIPDLHQQIAKGEFGQLKTWLNQNVHAHGQQYSPEELCTMATGSPLDVRHFIRYAKEKFGKVYGVKIT